MLECGAVFVRGAELRRVEVLAYEDRAHPEGGHAVLVIPELDGLPDGATFQLRSPEEQSGFEVPEGWPRGHHFPVETRSAGNGAEFVVGPAVADNELLLPGTVVRIEIPSAEVWGEFVWPDVPPTRRPRRRNLIVNRKTRTSRAGVMLPPHPAGLGEDAAAADAVDAEWQDTDARGSEVLGSAAAGVSDRFDQAAEGPAEGFRLSADDHGLAQDDFGGEGQVTSVVQDDARFGAPAAQAVPYDNEDETDPAYAAEATLSRLLQLETFQPRIEAQTSANVPDLTADPVAKYSRRSQQDYSSHASSRGWSPSAMEPDFQPAVARRSISIKTLVGAGLAAIVGGAAAIMLLAPDKVFGPRNGRAGPTVSVYNAGDTAVGDDDTPDSLFEALAVGPTSPRGTTADLPLARVLENANKNAMTSAAAADREEGAFWRKRYIVGALGNDRTKKALTQLGSLFAEPTGQAPDFAKARLLWEVASAAGDPVAMCFLGQLHESGLSVAADKKSALQWYERAKQAGGCPSLEESIARVRQ